MEHQDITQKIIGAAMKVHNRLGCGFQEVIYQRALAIEFKTVGLDFFREYEMEIFYRDQLVGPRRVDFLVEENVMVEIKAVVQVEDVHFAQAINYLEASGASVGLLINFGANKLVFRRLFGHRHQN